MNWAWANQGAQSTAVAENVRTNFQSLDMKTSWVLNIAVLVEQTLSKAATHHAPETQVPQEGLPQPLRGHCAEPAFEGVTIGA